MKASKQVKAMTVITAGTAVLSAVALFTLSFGGYKNLENTNGLTAKNGTVVSAEDVKEIELSLGLEGRDINLLLSSESASEEETEDLMDNQEAGQDMNGGSSDEVNANCGILEPFLADTQYYMNVRATADENSHFVGILPYNAGGSIIEVGERWTKIKSGSVVGYVATDCIWKSGAAVDMFYQRGLVKAIVTSDEVVAKTGPAVEYTDALVLSKDAEVKVVSKEGSYTKCIYGEVVCFIPNTDLAIYYSYASGLNGGEMTDYIVAAEQKKAEAEAAAAEAARKEAEAKKAYYAANQTQTATVYTGATAASVDDAYLLACLVCAEAGYESYEGKLATANIVLNRVRSGEFPNTIAGVIYAPNQFAVVGMGALARVLANGPNQDSINAANAALAGTNNVPNYLYFCSLGSAQNKYGIMSSYTQICNQVFYSR